MDFTVILLILILIVILYLFYVYFIASTSALVASSYLLSANAPVVTTTSPTITNFSVGLWIYVNSWNTQVSKNIFKMGVTKPTIANFLSLDLGATSPTLTTSIRLKNSSEPQIIPITNNFPVQKWVYVIISFSNIPALFLLNPSKTMSSMTRQTRMGNLPFALRSSWSDSN